MARKKSRYSYYPVGVVLIQLLNDSGLSHTQFFENLGYKNTAKALKGFDQWLQQGAGPSDLIEKIKQWQPGSEAALDLALDQTNALIDAQYEKRRAEQRERERAAFVPYIQAIPEESRPRSITFYALTGGNRRQRIELPPDILERSDEERLRLVAEHIDAHMKKSGGTTLYQGRIVYFQVHWRFEETPVNFSLSGSPIGPEEDRTPPQAAVTLAGGKTIPFYLA